MLRRKLLLVMSAVIALLMVAGVSAILLLQDVLRDLDHLSEQAMAGAAASATIQLRLSDAQAIVEKTTDDWNDTDAQRLHTAKSDIADWLKRMARIDSANHDMATALDNFEIRRREFGARMDEVIAAPPTASNELRTIALATITQMRGDLDTIDAAYRDHIEAQQASATSKLRWTALSFGLAFLLVINLSIMVLSRMSSMILKPVDALVEASRHLAREEFDYRVDLHRRDEFGELGQAYNNLAAQLQANESRKVETLHQLARTLNHELNNAIAIIQLQLEMVERSGSLAGIGGNGVQSDRLREIHNALARMTGIVASLTRVRRIVLTDYLSGVKMLDLEKSVDHEPDVHVSSTPIPPASAAR